MLSIKKLNIGLRVIFSGGLGNQLFQLFAALKILETHDFDRLGYSQSFFRSKAEVRSFGLDALIDFSRLCWLYEDSRAYDRIAFKIANRVSNNLALSFNYWNGKGACDKALNGPITLAGYFQDLDLLPARDKVRSLFGQSQDRQRNAIALHLRRGDYLDKKNNHYGVVSFADALKALRAIDDGISEILIFSDADIKNELANAMMPREIERTTMASSLCSGSVSEFSLMRTCRVIVCANSTFSWWAAFSGIPETVLLPSMWKKGDSTGAHFIFDGASTYPVNLE
jgi:hypothetical protein